MASSVTFGVGALGGRVINDLASSSHALNRQRQSVRTARCRAPRAAAGDTDASGDSKFTNADAFKVLDAIGGDNALKKASSPFGGNGGASNPFAASATPAAAFIAGFTAPSVDKSSLPTKGDADRLLSRFDKEQRLGKLPDENTPEGSKQCTHPPMRQSCRALASQSSRVMMGICAPDSKTGIETLKAWVTDLGLPRGKLHGLDVDGVETPPPEGPVFLKYNSDSGDAFLSGYGGEFRGVLFTPELGDGAFRQYGYLPLELPRGGEE